MTVLLQVKLELLFTSNNINLLFKAKCETAECKRSWRWRRKECKTLLLLRNYGDRNLGRWTGRNNIFFTLWHEKRLPVYRANYHSQFLDRLGSDTNISKISPIPLSRLLVPVYIQVEEL